MADTVRDREALKLRRAGVPIPTIRTQLKFQSDQAVEDAVARALEAAPIHGAPNEVRLLELDRLDTLLQGIWLKAARGDIPAIDRVLKISEWRMRWAGTPADQLILTAAYDKVIGELGLKAIDGAAVAAGRIIAEQIDIARASGDPYRVTKAMYLMPHLMGVLDKLGATPAARDEINAAAPNAPALDAPKVPTDFDEFRQRHGIV